jgi:hypothetical protein
MPLPHPVFTDVQRETILALRRDNAEMKFPGDDGEVPGLAFGFGSTRPNSVSHHRGAATGYNGSKMVELVQACFPLQLHKQVIFMACYFLFFIASVWPTKPQSYLLCFSNRLSLAILTVHHDSLLDSNCYSRILWDFYLWWWGWFPFMAASTPISQTLYVNFDLKR